MAKRAAQQARQQLFNIDLESLLTSELSPLKQNDSQSSTSEPCKHPKKFKTKENSELPANKVKTTRGKTRNEKEENDELEGTEEVYDVTKFFENVGNDFSRSLQVRKSRLGQFTDSVISVYQSKITEMIKKHEVETEKLKEEATNNIEEELNKCEEEFKKLQQQESKLIKILEQQLKMLQKTSEAQKMWLEHFRKLHHNYLQAFEELKEKHKKETLELKSSLAADVSDLQSKFLVETKKEEMKTVKKYLSSICF